MIVAIEPEYYLYSALAYRIEYPTLTHTAALHMAGVHPGNKTPDSQCMYERKDALLMSELRVEGWGLARLGQRFNCVASTVSRTLQYYDLPNKKGAKA